MRRIIFIIGMTLGMCFCVCARGQVKKDIWSEVSTHNYRCMEISKGT